jgi:hypothetical protein
MDLPYHIGCDRSVTDSFFLKKKDESMERWGNEKMGRSGDGRKKDKR